MRYPKEGELREAFKNNYGCELEEFLSPFVHQIQLAEPSNDLCSFIPHLRGMVDFGLFIRQSETFGLVLDKSLKEIPIMVLSVNEQRKLVRKYRRAHQRWRYHTREEHFDTDKVGLFGHERPRVEAHGELSRLFWGRDDESFLHYLVRVRDLVKREIWLMLSRSLGEIDGAVWPLQAKMVRNEIRDLIATKATLIIRGRIGIAATVDPALSLVQAGNVPYGAGIINGQRCFFILVA